MLVTFHSKAWSSVTLFGDVAVRLLKMMGHSGTVPSALLAENVNAAVARLKKELAAGVEEEGKDSPHGRSADAPSTVTLSQRAYPLIQLLSAADQKRCDVMWEEGQPAV